MDKVHLQQAAAQIQAMMKAFRAFSDGEQAVSALINSEAVLKQHQDELAKVKQELPGVRSQLDVATKALTEAKTEAKSILDDARERSKVIVQDAQKKAQGVDEKAAIALRDAEDMRAQAASQVMTVEEQVARARRELQALASDLEAARETIALAKKVKGLLGDSQ